MQMPLDSLEAIKILNLSNKQSPNLSQDSNPKLLNKIHLETHSKQTQQEWRGSLSKSASHS